VFFFKPTKLFPKFIKALTGVMERKWFNILIFRGSEINIMNLFADILSNYKRFSVDCFNFFSFNKFHGYAPLLILDYQPTYRN